MADRSRAVAFDLDASSLSSLREAFPGWEIEAVQGATACSLAHGSSLGAAELLVVEARGEVLELVTARARVAPLRRPGTAVADLLGLCRGLRSEAGWARTPLLVLVPPAQDALVRAVLKAGGTSCLILPVHVKDLLSMVQHARAGNRPGRHTLHLDRAQFEDSWQDVGGQG